jgi:thioredoxin-related protein
MRFHLIALLLAFTGATASAGESNIRFVDATWTSTIEQASSSNKMIFLDCYTDWCYWCKVMDKETFMDTSVTNLINSKFVPSKREMEKSEEGRALSMKYHVNGFPTYLVFDSKGILVYEIVGYRKADEFRDELNKALAATAPLYPGFSAALDPGFPEFYRKSFGTSKERKKADPKEIDAFLAKQSDLSSEVSWAVMWRFNVSEKYETWIFDNKKKLSELYGQSEVDDKIVNIIFARVDRAAEKKDAAAFKEALTLVNQHVPEQAVWLNFQLSLNYYQSTGDWSAYSAAVEDHINVNGYKSTSTINGCAWTIYEQCDDMDVVKKATVWMDSVCAQTEEYAFEDTYAALLYKSRDYKKAETVALHAIDLGTAAGEDVSGTEALLANIRLKKK